MLQNISWSDYLTFIVLSSAVYYAWVLFVYYRHDLLSRAKAKRPVSANALQFQSVPAPEQPTAFNHENYLPKEKADPLPMLQPFTDEVKAYLEEAGNNETSKEVLLQCLTVIAGKYPPFADSDYRDSVIQFIIQEAEMNCAVSLSENEVRRIWNGA